MDYELTSNGMLERYHMEDGKLVIETIHDDDSILEENKILRNMTDGYSKTRDTKHVGRVPVGVWHKWTKEAQKANIRPGTREFMNFVTRKLNDAENMAFRIGTGKIGIK